MIPPLVERFRSDSPLELRDPEKDAGSLRYWRFHNECVADGIKTFAQTARELIPAETRLGCFYGYIMQLTGKRLVQCGHLAYEKVFSLPELDFFISPGVYEDREMGGGSGFMSPSGTLRLNHKNYFSEIDHATSTANFKLTKHVSIHWMHRWPDTQADIAGIRREFCHSLLQGASLWWFDMWGGYFQEPILLKEIADFLQLHERYADAEREADAEIAIIVDPASTYYINDETENTIANLYVETLVRSNHLGTPYQVFSFNDIPRISDLKKYKLVIFPGLFEVTSEKEALLRQYILCDNRTVLWICGTALFDDKRKTPGRMEELTGFAPDTTKISRLEQKNWCSVFAPDTRNLSVEELQKMAQDAGVHLYSDMCCPVWVADDLLMVHTMESGPRKITLKRPGQVEVLLGHAIESADEQSFIYNFQGPETILVRFQ